MSAREQPNPEIATPARIEAVLRQMGQDWAANLNLTLPLPPIMPLVPRDPAPKDWWVGHDVIVTYKGHPDAFPVGPWSCDCTASMPAHCIHVAQAILYHAWNSPTLRPLFNVPAWSVSLEPLRQRPIRFDEEPEQGFIRYCLLWPHETRSPLPVKREIIRLSKRDGRELRSLPLPETAEALERRIQGVTPVDLEFHRADARMQALQRVVRQNPPGLDTNLNPIIDEAVAEAFACLLKVDELWFQGTAITPSNKPFVPHVIASDGPDAIHLQWRQGVVAVFPIGPGYVITNDDRFAALDPSVPREAFDFLTEDLPSVPFNEAGDFLDRFVHQSAIPVELMSHLLPQVTDADAIEGHVHLHEDDDILEISLRFGYRLGADRASVEPRDGCSYVSLGEAMIARDRDAEHRLQQKLERVIGRPLPALLRGLQALDFLTNARMLLGPDFTLFGTESLHKHRIVAHLKPKLTLKSGTDWFDLRLTFYAGDREIPAAEVLQSWQRGQRYHRLKDGTVASLPEEWLEKYGEQSLELEELQSQGTRVGLFAAPLLGDLLDEAEGDVLRWRELAQKLGDLQSIPRRDPPANLQAQLRPYQQAGYEWLCFLRDLHLGGCLADDMGLGKTLQSIALLLDEHDNDETKPPSLVVAPTSVIFNWCSEIQHFAPTLKACVYHGSNRELGDLKDAQVVITSYALLRVDENLQRMEWNCALLDEAQQIKNPASQVARVARNLKAKHRLALTGTPLENHLFELWSIFEYVMPGFFGSRHAFARRYATPIQRDDDKNAAQALRRRLKPFILRRLKSEVATELPPRQEQILYCELGELQRNLYERVKATYRQSVLEKVRQVGIGAATLSILEALMRLRQACCDPGLLPFAEARALTESAKIHLLMHTLRRIIENGHRCLVFSQWPSLLRRIAQKLDQQSLTYLYLDGSTQHRQDLVEQWNDPEGPPLFLISLKAGGSGLNLTGADHVIHVDPWWNPAVEAQATDRAHRIGQDKPVVAYKLVARDTVEEKILELQSRKKALFETAIERDRLVVEQLTRADLEGVFALSDENASLEPLTFCDDPPDIPEIQTPPPAPQTDTKPLPAAAIPQNEIPERLIEHLRKGGRLNNASVRDLMGWPAEEARRWLQKQVKEGLLEQRGEKRGTHYVLTQRA